MYRKKIFLNKTILILKMKTICKCPFLLLFYKNLAFHFNTCTLISYIAFQKDNRIEKKASVK